MSGDFSLLNNIHFPDDLRKLDRAKLPNVCAELRQFIIDEVSCNPGHFGASLGTVELTVALHYAFNTPYDRLVWDVGHQAYGHKILTGRRNVFHSNRKINGLSGFPKRQESDYDAFGVGHSSTSISAALGMAIAAEKNNENRQAVAIIGDGAFTGGMAFEGLNNATVFPNNLLIILNDNEMAISPNVGGIREYLVDIATSKTYNKFRSEFAKILGKMQLMGKEEKELIQKFNNNLKSLITKQSNLFEGFNIRYFGPVDGHDVGYLVDVLNDLKQLKGPKVLHIKTKKGKGFGPAELAQTEWHAPGRFDKETGLKIKKLSKRQGPVKYQEVFGQTLLELAKENDKILGVTPAMSVGCSMDILMSELPSRAFDVGIAEQHAVTFSAGLATEGYIPFCNIYSTFLQRAYDQVIHDAAIQKLPVILCIDRGGLVGEDGPTHHGVYDLAFLRCIPDIIISSPLNEMELRNLMYTAQEKDRGTFAIRYPRGKGGIADWKQPMISLEIGKGECLIEGSDVAVLTIGTVGNRAMLVANSLKEQGYKIGVYNMRFLKPIDTALLHNVFSKYTKIVTVEDGTIVGGLGSAVLEVAMEFGFKGTIKRLGVPDNYITHGRVRELESLCGFDKESIRSTILHLMEK